MTPASLNSTPLLGGGMVSAASGILFKHEAEEMSGVEPVHRSPTVEAVADIRRYALLARETDQQRDEAVVAIAVYRWRKPDYRHPHAACHTPNREAKTVHPKSTSIAPPERAGCETSAAPRPVKRAAAGAFSNCGRGVKPSSGSMRRQGWCH